MWGPSLYVKIYGRQILRYKDGPRTKRVNLRECDVITRVSACLASHVCAPGSNPTVPVSSFSMWLGDHGNGDLVELRLRPVYRRQFRAGPRSARSLHRGSINLTGAWREVIKLWYSVFKPINPQTVHPPNLSSTNPQTVYHLTPSSKNLQTVYPFEPFIYKPVICLPFWPLHLQTRKLFTHLTRSSTNPQTVYPIDPFIYKPTNFLPIWPLHLQTHNIFFTHLTPSSTNQRTVYPFDPFIYKPVNCLPIWHLHLQTSKLFTHLTPS